MSSKERNLTTINSQLVDKSVGYFHTKIFEKESNKSKMNVNRIIQLIIQIQLITMYHL